VSEIRKNLVKNRWVAVASDRALKPNDFPTAGMGINESETRGGFCPFCGGNEEYTPPEIAAYRPDNQQPDSPGWLIRAIPNKFSAFLLEGELKENYSGIYSNYNGLGQHEVIIETPEHSPEYHEFELERVEKIISMFKNRYNSLAGDTRIKYIQIYKNRGMFGGASLGHSHSQIVGLPFDPQENEGMVQYYEQKGSCLICDILKQEQESKERIIYEGENFLIICPYAPRFAYESWIVPKRHMEHFGEINPLEEKELALLSRKITMAVIDSLDNPSYNFVINSAPVNVPYQAGYHWFWEITPRMLVAAGVEVATGVYINPVAPELAANILKESFQTML